MAGETALAESAQAIFCSMASSSAVQVIAIEGASGFGNPSR